MESTYLDWFLQMSEIFHGSLGYPLPGKKSTGPAPATETCLELGETRLDQHFPHGFVWKITVKTCKNKNPNLMANTLFPLILDCYLAGISYFQTAEWLMIYELFHNVSHVSWGFFDLDGFFWRWNWEVTAKSEKTAPGSQSLTKKLTDRSWPQSEKNGSKNEEIKGGELEHPTKWGFKGKIKLNGGFSRPSLPKGI